MNIALYEDEQPKSPYSNPKVKSISLKSDNIGHYIGGRKSGSQNSWIGNFEMPAWRDQGHMYKLDAHDTEWVSKVKLKAGEIFCRYDSRVTRIGGMEPLIKVNVDKGLVYFLTDEAEEKDEPIFEPKGLKVQYMNIIDTININEAKNENIGKRYRRENSQGGYNYYEATSYSEEYGYHLVALNLLEKDITVTNKEFQKDFEEVKEAKSNEANGDYKGKNPVDSNRNLGYLGAPPSSEIKPNGTKFRRKNSQRGTPSGDYKVESYSKEYGYHLKNLKPDVTNEPADILLTSRELKRDFEEVNE